MFSKAVLKIPACLSYAEGKHFLSTLKFLKGDHTTLCEAWTGAVVIAETQSKDAGQATESGGVVCPLPA